MQDIVFYAVANETLGMVRDYANARRKSAPVLALGVSVRLRMRVFAEPNNAAPYPIDSFDTVTEWQWNMDDDFDRNTACKLAADSGDISVHTVTDTINGETMNFTEFVIPISNMNTEELATWIGSGKTRSGLTGELVGYDELGQAVFVLQIENFTVRNRVAGLADPTALDQEIVTRTQAELMIQTAVSASAATKQDLLTSTNAGTGISVSSAGVISVSDVPQSAVTGLTTSLAGLSSSLAAKQDSLTPGYRMTLVNGATVGQARYFAIEPVVTARTNQTTTVVLSAGKAYEIHAVASNAKVLLNREDPVGGDHTFGLEGHIEIFVANTGYVQTGANVVLANALVPDAVNNCTVRFHDGYAIISVEDHVAGYVVTIGTGSTAGTLPYALSSASQEYVAFDASLNGRALDMAGAVTNGEKHVVGNSYADTVLTGGVSCTSKTTFANLAMSGAAVTGGATTLGDVYLPQGGTLTFSSGSVVFEKVTGDGGTIDLGGTHVVVSENTTVSVSGCTITGGYAANENGGAFRVNKDASVAFKDVTISGNSAFYYGGGMYLLECASAVLSNCVIFGNRETAGPQDISCVRCSDVRLYGCTVGAPGSVGSFKINSGGTHLLSGCDLRCGLALLNGATVSLDGSNTVGDMISGTNCSAVISGGAVIDLTGNAKATPIAPGGGITLYGGQAEAPTVIRYGSGGNTRSRTFEDLEVRGSTITNLGLVYGATVTSLEGYDHEIVYTSDGGTTSDSVIVSGATTYIVPGGLMKISNT